MSDFGHTNYKYFFYDLKIRLQQRIITYDQAKEEAQTVLDEMNKKGKEIANKHGVKYRPFTFSSMIR